MMLMRLCGFDFVFSLLFLWVVGGWRIFGGFTCCLVVHVVLDMFVGWGLLFHFWFCCLLTTGCGFDCLLWFIGICAYILLECCLGCYGLWSCHAGSGLIAGFDLWVGFDYCWIICLFACTCLWFLCFVVCLLLWLP